jgi:hypothetical protein
MPRNFLSTPVTDLVEDGKTIAGRVVVNDTDLGLSKGMHQRLVHLAAYIIMESGYTLAFITVTETFPRQTLHRTCSWTSSFHTFTWMQAVEV